VRGIRFNLAPPGTTTLDMVKPLAKRIAPMGRQIQVNAAAAYLLNVRDTCSDLPCPVMFDHLAHIHKHDAMHHPAVSMVTELLLSKKAYVKLTGFYNGAKVGPPTYSDSVEVAPAYAQAALDRGT